MSRGTIIIIAGGCVGTPANSLTWKCFRGVACPAGQQNSAYWFATCGICMWLWLRL